MSSPDAPNPIKEAFFRIKEDMASLQEQILILNEQMEYLKRTIISLTPTQTSPNPPIQQINPTHSQTPTDNLSFQASKSPNQTISTGNEGVPTDSQTHQQSDTFQHSSAQFSPQKSPFTPPTDKITQIQRVSEVLESLDSIKKEVRANFKRLTKQEMTVFSLIYSLEEQGLVIDYSLISGKLALSESSVRDHVNKIVKKGIPLLKSKENNKKIILSISPELKQIASLQTILALREL